jgi:glycosyltransferase involved in cell wall biosynthesis
LLKLLLLDIPLKIAVITPIFALAGVPLAQMRFARSLAARGHSVDLIIGRILDDYAFSPPPGLSIKVLKQRNVRGMLWPLVRYLHQVKPNVIFSAEDHLNAIVLLAAVLAGSRAKISASSRVTPFDTYSDQLFSKKWVLKQAMKALMPRADVLTCVSQGTVDEYRKVFKSPRHVCVYNIIDDSCAKSHVNEANHHPWLVNDEVPVLVGAGRLAPWKGFDVAIKALAILVRGRNVRMIILGDGPERQRLQQLIESLKLEKYVHLQGYVKNPFAYYVHANVFVHAARVESLGNVLVEAMMCGCTPVAADCPTGPREILQGGKYGYLVPMDDPSALAQAIDHAIDNPIRPQLLKEGVAPFEQSRIINRHFQLLGLPL